MKKILFIEDEAALQKTFNEILNNHGYKVVSALDGKTGLRLAETINPDLILLDLVLPKIHGFEVLKKMKQNEKMKNIPIIILTNSENIENINKSIELGASAYLIKANYSLNEIIEKVKKTLKE
ncbi:MAG: response regulator [Patescibacteria group bacterium]|nr:response regulator [Patescibacteria group bacterium]